MDFNKFVPAVVREHPYWSSFAGLIFFFIVTLPIWLVQVWSLFSDKPFFQVVSGTKWEFLVIGPLYGWFCFGIGLVLTVLVGLVVAQGRSSVLRHMADGSAGDTKGEPAVYVGRIVPIVNRLQDEHFFELAFVVFNGTGRELVIDRTPRGSFVCNEKRSTIPASIPDAPTPQSRRRDITITVRQYLKSSDAHDLKQILDSDDTMSVVFSDIHIVGRLEGGGRPPQEIEVPLPDGVTIKRGLMLGEHVMVKISGAGGITLTGGMD